MLDFSRVFRFHMYRNLIDVKFACSRFFKVGRSFFSDSLERRPVGQGVESWRGFYQSIRPTQMGLSLNVGNVVTTMQYQDVLLVLIPLVIRVFAVFRCVFYCFF